MSSPSAGLQSEDDLFDTPRRRSRPSEYETMETAPVQRVQDSPEHDTLSAIPFHKTTQPTQTQQGISSQMRPSTPSRHFTQPTQIIGRSSPTDVSSPPTKPVVQVTASSPVATPAMSVSGRKPSGILASAMAPAGTAFRRPQAPNANPAAEHRRPPTWSFDDEGPASSDSDRAERERNNIKTTTFARKPQENRHDTSRPAGNDTFSSIMREFSYPGNRSDQGIKRSSDTMADAYGNASKKPRQAGPSRAMSATAERDLAAREMELEDIQDPNMRNKVRRLRSTCVTESVKDCLNALLTKKGNYDDAADYLLLMSEKRDNDRKSRAIDLTGSDDELGLTPAAKKASAIAQPPINAGRQQPRKPVQSITQKWSSTQGVSKKPLVPEKKTLDVFEQPPPQAVPKKRTLIRGRKDRGSPPPTQVATKPVVIDDDSGDEAKSDAESEPEDKSFNSRLLHFFNACTALDLSDTAGVTKDIAEHVVSQRPFKNFEQVSKIEAPNLKTTKNKRRANPLGTRVLDKVEEMLRSYEAVDYLVRRCEAIAAPLATSMKAWGIDVYGKAAADGELDLVSLQTPDSQISSGSHDSGIGTPVSDDDRDAKTASLVKRGFSGQPASMAEGVVMKDYQIVGINWLHLLFKRGLSCILADDMGLGKTLQTIAFIAYIAEQGQKGPHLIVVPAATLENWLKEFHRFCPGLNVEPYYATNPTERFQLREHIDETRDEINVIVTTYTLAKGKEDFPWLKNFGFVCTVFDEGHMLKNAKSDVSKKLVRIQSQWRLLLTGTPLQNNLQELMSLLGFLMPKLFNEKTEELEAIFKQQVNTITEDASSREMLLSKKRIARARSMLTPFILRRKKWQVLKDLPKKERKVEYCNMTSEQTEIYNGWLAKAWDIRERKTRGGKVGADENSNVLMKLRQAAIHPLLFRSRYKLKTLKRIAQTCLRDDMYRESNPDLILEELRAYSDFEVYQLCSRHQVLNQFMLSNDDLDSSGKVQTMLRLLSTFRADGHRTLIFSQFVMVLDILEVVLNHHGIKYFRLDGTTKVAERQDLIDEFSAPDCDADVFMLSTKAGGAGINLAAANRVIVFDSGFNPQDDVQAENRAHRIGQTKEVEVWRLVTSNTVEEQIYKMGVIKLKLDREVAGEGVDDLEGTSNKADQEIEQEGERAVEEMLFQKIDGRPPVVQVGEGGNDRSDDSKDNQSGQPQAVPVAERNRTIGDDDDDGDDDSSTSDLSTPPSTVEDSEKATEGGKATNEDGSDEDDKPLAARTNRLRQNNKKSTDYAEPDSEDGLSQGKKSAKSKGSRKTSGNNKDNRFTESKSKKDVVKKKNKGGGTEEKKSSQRSLKSFW